MAKIIVSWEGEVNWNFHLIVASHGLVIICFSCCAFHGRAESLSRAGIEFPLTSFDGDYNLILAVLSLEATDFANERKGKTFTCRLLWNINREKFCSLKWCGTHGEINKENWVTCGCVHDPIFTHGLRERKLWASVDTKAQQQSLFDKVTKRMIFSSFDSP